MEMFFIGYMIYCSSLNTQYLFFKMIPEANPLLSPDKYVDESPASFMLAYNTPSQIQLPSKISAMSHHKPSHSFKQHKKKEEESHRLVYQRINNDKLNLLVRTQNRFPSSVFLQLKALARQSFSYDMIASPGVAADGPIHFNSKFESGNLLQAFSLSHFDYELHLQNDINTKGHPQWFFFEISTELVIRITLSITNMGKSKSLFQQGMKPFTFNGNWKRLNVQKIEYYQSKSNRKQHQFGLYSTLKMTLELNPGSTMLAYSIPYTLKRMNELVKRASFYFIVETIASTVSGRELLVLSGGNKKQPVVWVIARQHPGESPGSLLFQGFLDGILQAPELLDEYYFKLVPMVNPDGVVAGNYRTNLAGVDLNRKWIHPSPESTPQIYGLRAALMDTKERTAFFIDCHSHSRNQGTFFYGMNNEAKGKEIYSQMLPYMMSKKDHRFCMQNCTFTVNPSKLSTARSVVGREIRGFAYTVQTSFHGYFNEKGDLKSYEQKDYLQMGRSLLQGVVNMKGYVLVRKFNYPKTDEKLHERWKMVLRMERQFKQKKMHFAVDSGSDSNPEEGFLSKKQREVLNKVKDKGIFLISNSSNPCPVSDSLGRKMKGTNRYSNFRSKVQDIYMKRSNYDTMKVGTDYEVDKNSFSQEQGIFKKISLHKEESFSRRYYLQRQEQLLDLQRDISQPNQTTNKSMISERFKNAFGKLRVKNQQLQFRLKKINIMQY